MSLGVVKEKELVQALTKAGTLAMAYPEYESTLCLSGQCKAIEWPSIQVCFFKDRRREDGGVLPLQGISPQLPGHIKDEDGKDRKAFQAAATQALSIKHGPAKGLLYPACTTTHFTIKQNSRTAFLLHIDPLNLIHSENYRGNEVFQFPIWTPEIIIPPPLHQKSLHSKTHFTFCSPVFLKASNLRRFF